MAKPIKILAWIMVALGAIFFLLVPVVLLESGDKGAAAGFVMFGLFCGLPGGIALWRSIVRERETSFRDQVGGMMRSHDRFTIEELARKIGRTELETERLINEIAHAQRLDLVFHRSTREYLHRNRIREAHRVLDQCAACGARLPHEVVLDGEAAICQYCGSALT